MNKKLITSVLAAAMITGLSFSVSADVADLPERMPFVDVKQLAVFDPAFRVGQLVIRQPQGDLFVVQSPDAAEQ